jgi:hypothetical protein
VPDSVTSPSRISRQKLFPLSVQAFLDT